MNVWSAWYVPDITIPTTILTTELFIFSDKTKILAYQIKVKVNNIYSSLNTLNCNIFCYILPYLTQNISIPLPYNFNEIHIVIYFCISNTNFTEGLIYGKKFNGLLILWLEGIHSCTPHFVPFTNFIYVSLSNISLSYNSMPDLLYVVSLLSLYKPLLCKSLVFPAVNYSDSVKLIFFFF